MRGFFLFLTLAIPSLAGIVDRLAITIGYQAITELQIDEEIRITALLNRKPVLRDANSRRDAADRLVQQFLIKREIEESRYPAPNPADTDAYVRQVKEQLGGPSAVADALQKYSLDDTTLRNHLQLQLTTLRFIELRFRPEVSVSDADVQAYLNHQRLASMPNGADSIREILIEERTDQALSVWLEEARKRFNIVYLDRTLQ